MSTPPHAGPPLDPAELSRPAWGPGVFVERAASFAVALWLLMAAADAAAQFGGGMGGMGGMRVGRPHGGSRGQDHRFDAEQRVEAHRS